MSLLQITRADFELASADLFAKLTVPVEAALLMANLTMNDVNVVELLGGSVRIPKVKKVCNVCNETTTNKYNHSREHHLDSGRIF